MAKSSKKKTASGSSGDILNLIPEYELYPWENAEHFDALEKAFLIDFAPATALEVSLVKRLAANEWEQHRSDKLRADITRTCLRKLALDALDDGELQSLPNPVSRKLANALVGDDIRLRKETQEQLAKIGIDLADLHAQAYLQSFREFEALARRADVFDRRRRDLLEDLRGLLARRSTADIEDAELVQADGD